MDPDYTGRMCELQGLLAGITSDCKTIADEMFAFRIILFKELRRSELLLRDRCLP